MTIKGEKNNSNKLSHCVIGKFLKFKLKQNPFCFSLVNFFIDICVFHRWFLQTKHVRYPFEERSTNSIKESEKALFGTF